MKDIRYDCRWSTEADEDFIEHFCRMQETVFGLEYPKERFRKKFLENIYGPSVVEVVYDYHAPIAARALWRNDIDGREAYQPCDTCVTEECQGNGIFKYMTAKSLELLPEGVPVYNFPNQNSFPGYMKMGWELKGTYRTAFFSPEKFVREHPVDMDDEYAAWWMEGKKNHFHIERNGQYFLVSPLYRKGFYQVISRISEQTANRFPRLKAGILLYETTRTTFYNKGRIPLHVVAKADGTLPTIPLWKMDVC